MRILSEEQIIVIRTFYGFDDNDAEGLAQFTVKGVKIEVKSDDGVLYEKFEDESLIRTDTSLSDPVERFLDYIFYKEKWCSDYKQALQKKKGNRIQVSNIICLIVAVITLAMVVFKKHIGL